MTECISQHFCFGSLLALMLERTMVLQNKMYLMTVCVTTLLVADAAVITTETLDNAAACTTAYSPNDDLKFINPRPEHLESFPPELIYCMEGRYQVVRCCGTGYQTVTWYFNNEVISQSDERFDISDVGQVLHWLEPDPVGFSRISCELVKNESETLRHDMLVEVIANCEEPAPYYTIAPESSCASPGDNITFQCEVHFGDGGCIDAFFKDVMFEDKHGQFINSFHEGYENVQVETVKADDEATSVLGSITFYEITKDQLNMTFYCMPRTHSYMKVGFNFLGSCSNKTMDVIATTPLDKKIATRVTIFVLVIAFVVMLAAALLYLYRKELTILWNTYIKCLWNAGQKHSDISEERHFDAYIVCSKTQEDQEFLTSHLIKELEKYYNICIPDRDFLIGSVIPVEMTEYVKRSLRVIVITSSNLLETDYCDLSINVAIANHIPLIFVKPPSSDNPADKQKLDEMISERPELSAALAVSKVLKYPKKANADNLSSFYNVLYSAMPVANRSDIMEISQQHLATGIEEKLS
ncbi:interleukin-1 receptor accessory protein-like [Watersipora subatra]|uniref:interleukin-1 receptor accessory protein-like n=1 Tax=Watersipora subatra TaxID=2589382 RepID=UPI00355AECBC